VSLDGKSPIITCSHLTAASIAVCIQGLKIPSLDVDVRSRQILYLEASLLKHGACKPYRPAVSGTFELVGGGIRAGVGNGVGAGVGSGV
jgi:hypothetical protein